MDDLDTLLRESNPVPAVSEYAAELTTELARSRMRRRPRRRTVLVVVGIVAGTLALGGGGLAAAAQAGWIGASRYVDGPDMTGVHQVTVRHGVNYECQYSLHAEADYQQPQSYQEITNGVAEAHRYLRTLDPLKIKTDPALIDNETDGAPAPAQSSPDDWRAKVLFDAWVRTVEKEVDQHLADLRKPSVGMETVYDCQAAPTK